MSEQTLALAYVIEHEWGVVRDLSVDDRTAYVRFIADTFALLLWLETGWADLATQ